MKNPLVVPLYPQYSRSTTESIIDVLPKGTRVVRDFHDDAGYVRALAASVEAHWAEHGRGELLLMSFHGLPQRAVDRGDPYQAQCFRTAALLADKLGLADK